MFVAVVMHGCQSEPTDGPKGRFECSESLSLSLCYLSVYLSASFYLSVYLSSLPICLTVYLAMLSIYLSNLSICLSIWSIESVLSDLSAIYSINPCIRSIYLSDLSIRLSVYLSTCRSVIYPSVHLCDYLSVNPICPSFVPIYLPTYLSDRSDLSDPSMFLYLSMYLPTSLPTNPCIYLSSLSDLGISICLSICCCSIYLSMLLIYLSIFLLLLSIWLSDLSIYLV